MSRSMARGLDILVLFAEAQRWGRPRRRRRNGKHDPWKSVEDLA